MAGIYVVCNPIAGNGAAKRASEQIQAELEKRNIPFTYCTSDYAGHAVELSQQAVKNGADKIIAIGGDGTLREVATALKDTEVTLGIIPCGTGNDLSRALHIPHDTVKALEIALSGERRQMDAAMANDELYFNVAGFGFDVDVLDATLLFKEKYKNGSIAYLRGLLHSMRTMKLRKTTITTPDGVLEKNCLIIAVGNGTHFGGGMMVTPKADPFDGLLDVCIGSDVTKAVLLRVLTKFLKGKHIAYTKYITYFKATEVTAVCEPASRIEVDGDVMPGTPVTFRVLPKALWVQVPARA